MTDSKAADCTHALGIPFMYDRINELGVPYDNPNWRARCSKRFYETLLQLGKYLKECGILPLDGNKAVLTGGCYVDKPGQHGKGNACDFDGFLTMDDEVILYKDGIKHEVEGYRIRSMSRKLASRIACAISLHAGVVITEHYNSRHEDHIHFDIGREVKWHGGRSRSQNVVTQAALKLWHDKSVKIDGKIGSQTRNAMMVCLGKPSSDNWKITNSRWKTFLDKVAGNKLKESTG